MNKIKGVRTCDIFIQTVYNPKKDIIDETKIWVYGHQFVKITMREKNGLSYKLTKLKKLANQSKESSRKYEEIRSHKGNQKERLDTLFSICNIKLMEDIMKCLKKKGESSRVELRKANRIAYVNSTYSKGNMKIVALEYSLLTMFNCNVFIDLVGIRINKDEKKIIISFIEYKCKTSSMTGKYGLQEHVRKMLPLIKIDNSKLLDRFSKSKDTYPYSFSVETEILLLLSDINVHKGLNKNSARAVLKNIDNMCDNNQKEFIKICIINNDSYKINVENIKTIDEAIEEIAQIK